MAEEHRRETQTIEEIANYHNDVSDSLRFYLGHLYKENSHRYLGRTLEEFEEELVERLAETDLRSSLALLTAIEAHLRDDFRFRTQSDRNDPLSDACIAYQKTHEGRIRLDDLLQLWKAHHPELKVLISKFKAAAHFRNWLAHGRYWQRSNDDRFDYSTVYDLATAILLNFPLLSSQ